MSLLEAASLSGGNLTTEYLIASGSDGYTAAFSLAELDPAFGAPEDLIADMENGAPIGSGDAFAQLIFPGDNHGGRFVGLLSSLAVAQVPEPSSALLLVAGIAAFAYLRRRFKVG